MIYFCTQKNSINLIFHYNQKLKCDHNPSMNFLKIFILNAQVRDNIIVTSFKPLGSQERPHPRLNLKYSLGEDAIIFKQYFSFFLFKKRNNLDHDSPAFYYGHQ